MATYRYATNDVNARWSAYWPEGRATSVKKQDDCKILRQLHICMEQEPDGSISRILGIPSLTNIKKIVNMIDAIDNPQEESLLMWAVWRLQPKNVKILLDWGADARYCNSSFDSVSTYWSVSIHDSPEQRAKFDEEKAIEIVHILQQKGVDLSQDSLHSYSLVRKIGQMNFPRLHATLRAYGYKIYPDSDDAYSLEM